MSYSGLLLVLPPARPWPPRQRRVVVNQTAVLENGGIIIGNVSVSNSAAV